MLAFLAYFQSKYPRNRYSNINIWDASVLAAWITGYGIYTSPETGPSLEICDEAFLKGGGAAQ